MVQFSPAESEAKSRNSSALHESISHPVLRTENRNTDTHRIGSGQ